MLPPHPVEPTSNIFHLRNHQPVDLEVIVPAYNEAGRIGPTIDALTDHLDSMPFTSNVRVIDNGSSDHTAEAVDDAVSGDHRTTITVEGCARRGKGSAVRRGMLTSRSRWVGFCDADLATPAAAITSAVSYLEDDWPVVIGSRHMQGSRLVHQQPMSRRAGGTGFRLLARHLSGTGAIADTQCGFKFFDAEAARALFTDVRSTGFAFDVEVLARAQLLGYPIKEFPVDWSDREGSTFRPAKHMPEVTRDLWRVRQHRRSEPQRLGGR